MIWRRSQKVVCIVCGPWGTKEPFSGPPPKSAPVNGGVYEIWDIITYPELPGFVGLALVEFPGYACDEKVFRPAVDRPTDISVFTKAPVPTGTQLEVVQ